MSCNSYEMPNFTHKLLNRYSGIEEEFHQKLIDENDSRKYRYFSKNNIFLESNEFIGNVFI